MQTSDDGSYPEDSPSVPDAVELLEPQQVPFLKVRQVLVQRTPHPPKQMELQPEDGGGGGGGRARTMSKHMVQKLEEQTIFSIKTRNGGVAKYTCYVSLNWSDSMEAP